MDALTAAPWWLLLIAGLGVVAIAAVVAALFLPDWHRYPLEAEGLPPAGTPEFVAAVATLLNVPVLRGRAEYLPNGVCFYPAMLEAIRGAADTINFQVYIFEPDRVGEEFIEAFMERARAGVEVRLLVDAFGSSRIDKATRRRLRQAGCRVARFRPLNLFTLARVFKRTHRRAIVVDGRVAFTGGAAVAEKWDGDARHPGEWRDSMTRITGPLVQGVQTAFADNWRYATGELLAGTRWFPQWPEGDPRDVGDETVGVAVASSPADSAQPVRLLIWLSLAGARRRVWLANSYFIPNGDIRRRLCECAQSGCDVRVMVPGPETDARPVRLAGRYYYEELLAAGVRVYEFTPTMMHDKLVVVDGSWSIVGSANLDERSMEINEENLVGVAGERLAEEIERALAADFERCEEITAEAWSRRSRIDRVLERLSLALVEQY